MSTDSAMAEQTEVARLEELLVARATEVRALQQEVQDLRRLLREQVRRMEMLPVPSPELTPELLYAGYQAAVSRALLAETGRAELAFRLDEALGQLHAAGSRDSKQAELHEAHLAGSIRGLRAAMADVEEARDVAQARLMLVEDDLQQARRSMADLRRQLLEAEEEQELLRLQEVGADEVAELRRRLEEVNRAAAEVRVTAEAENERLRALLEQVRGDLRALGEARHDEHTEVRPSANLTTAVGTSDAPAPFGAFTASTPPPAPPGDAATAKLSERLTRSEQLVRTLQGELGRERDERNEERKRADRELVAQSAACDALRDELERFKQQRAETARRTRTLLSLMPAGDPLAIQLGDLLASLDA